MKLIMLSGVSGSGKTWRRTHDPDLVDLPFVDVQDLYRAWPGAFAAEVAFQLRDTVRKALQRSLTVVAEGYLLRHSLGRDLLAGLAHQVGAEFVIIECWRPKGDCLAGVEAKLMAGDITDEEHAIQMDMIERLWKPRPRVRG